MNWILETIDLFVRINDKNANQSPVANDIQRPNKIWNLNGVLFEIIKTYKERKNNVALGFKIFVRKPNLNDSNALKLDSSLYFDSVGEFLDFSDIIPK